ncbi:RWD domain-containing protein 2A [Planococcus citri]|uniref:RWD domain-containing protein 2A n=1 Tax=Planococcus citri TaxID=170843 RepID=UPI0031F99FE3
MDKDETPAAVLDSSELRDHLRIQLEEIEVLQAVYYKDDEFVIDKDILSEIDNYVNELSSRVPSLIDFTINIKLDNVSLEFLVTLPRTYPNTVPQIIVRSNQLNRYQQNDLNEGLNQYITSLDRGMICMCESICWVTDNLQKYYDDKKNEPQSSQSEQKVVFSRFWIYSHHIYSKEKRRNILSLAQDHHITGFALVGKPGVICGEGLATDCEEWWKHIKRWTWKKIMCKKKEEFEVSFDERHSMRKFPDFSEINFQSNKNNVREGHTDMGEFNRYLVDHECGYAFKDCFGIEGKLSNS